MPDPSASLSGGWPTAERERNDQRTRDLRELADEDCRICRGSGQSSGYIAATKTAHYACPCTGRADFQREDDDA